MGSRRWGWIVPEELWEIASPSLPSARVRPQCGGVTNIDHKAVIAAVVYVLVGFGAPSAVRIRSMSRAVFTVVVCGGIHAVREVGALPGDGPRVPRRPRDIGPGVRAARVEADHVVGAQHLLRQLLVRRPGDRDFYLTAVGISVVQRDFECRDPRRDEAALGDESAFSEHGPHRTVSGVVAAVSGVATDTSGITVSATAVAATVVAARVRDRVFLRI
ncbi:hypothetical protein GCM10022420_088090 [Streptomyces iranensis]|uniref:Uncharacterized protein n=1 Tax=Streptomyces iranensis TaxID=576784 RepID=A0A061A7M9_9ACTN|nr:hypothetical protein [Streptomyces iranensis]CDR13063.1 predicted protein [Streptomyces iranensis]